MSQARDIAGLREQRHRRRTANPPPGADRDRRPGEPEDVHRGWIAPTPADAVEAAADREMAAAERAVALGPLLLGARESADAGTGRGGGRLRHIGHVGTGFRDAARDELRDLLVPGEQSASPVTTTAPEQRAAHWAAPLLVGEVRFRAWTDDGHHRHPPWTGTAPRPPP